MNDLRFAFRQLLRKPGFAAVTLLSLALGIGINATIFSILNTFLSPRLPFANPDRLVALWETPEHKEGRRRPSTFETFEQWRTQSQSFERMGLVDGATQPIALTGPTEAVRGLSQSVDVHLFPALGVPPALGRWFVPEDLEDMVNPQEARPIVISHQTWQDRLGGAKGAIGQALLVDGVSRPVLGVMPPGFWIVPGVDDVALWTCIDLSRTPASRRLLKVGRLKEGIALEQAQMEIVTISRRLEALQAADRPRWVPRLEELRRAYYSDTTPLLLFLHGAVGFVLLIGCANVANLLLAQGVARRGELAIRAAAGATRGRLIRQLLTESLVLSLLGGALGLLLVPGATHVFWTLAPDRIPLLNAVEIDGWVLAFTFVLAVLTGILCGLWPAVRVSKYHLYEVLQEGGRERNTGPRRLGRHGLLAFEVALAMVFLVGAGLMIAGFVRMQNTDLGFNPDNVLTTEIVLGGPPYLEKSAGVITRVTPRAALFCRQVLERIGQLPGVESAGMISRLPRQRLSLYPFVIAGRDAPVPGEEALACVTEVDAGLFKTLGIPLLKGRSLAEQDDARVSRVVVINQTLARRYFPDEDPIGKRVRIGSGNAAAAPGSQHDSAREIVGIVGDLNELVFRTDRPAVIYGSFQQPIRDDRGNSVSRDVRKNLVIRTSISPSCLADQVREIVRQLDPHQAVPEFKTLHQHLSDSLALNRFVMGLLSTFAGLAILLATLGIYGVTSYFVSQRTREFGIRMALGARKNDVVRMVIKQVLTPTVIGITLGMAVGLTLQLAVSRVVFGVSATTPVTYGVLALLMTGVAVVACLGPVRAATQVDPVVALRYE